VNFGGKVVARVAGGSWLVALVLALWPAPAPAATSPYLGPYTLSTNKYAFGQAPAFMPDGRIVFGKDFKKGDGIQSYIARQDGTALKCLTCGQPAPNNVPVPRPQGDWILFHSWRGHHLTIGSPGYGGMGSALYAIRPDGSKVTALTGTDAAHGAGEGEDDYHAYWSPDGRHIVYTHLNWNFATNGGDGKWDVRVADFVDDGKNPPHLANVRVVRPNNGHWYETQWWAPDGSGFLYTETWDTAENPELFYCRLTAKGCDSERLTKNAAWDEQAVFTPDMNSVIFMSSRDHPGFFNSFSQTSQAAGLTTDQDYLLILPVFEAGFLQPVGQEATDLYQLNLETKSVRRLTKDGDDGWIVPEFDWEPTRQRLWFTENRFDDRSRVNFPVTDPVKELMEAAKLLENPPTPETLSKPTAFGDIVLPLEQRTRIIEFPKAGVAGKRGCLARRSPIGPHNIGRVQIGLTRRQLLRRVPAPRTRTARSWRWCVKRSKGTVRATFTRAGKVALVATTARAHGNRGVRPGAPARRLRRSYPNRRALTRKLFRAHSGSARLFGLRGKRVSFIAVVPRRLQRRPRTLRADLRYAGVIR
jgi:Tol biopolymer transport system component